MVKYLLCVLTHGESPKLDRCLASIAARVVPEPASVYVHVDGEDVGAAAYRALTRRTEWEEWTLGGSFQQEGFCASTRSAWEYAVTGDGDYEFVFWVEGDFLFDRPVYLDPIATLLEYRRDLAQVSLMRNAVNRDEIAAGGLFEFRRDEYEQRLLTAATSEPTRFAGGVRVRGFPYLEHGSYFTTNPSLMRWGFMEENRWPDDPDHCEGRFGTTLRERGYRYAVWGEGEPWVTHAGVRTGFGY